ncbi:hypothetical protein BC943DRAFT_322891 [Umbelopsis sp. AD052]|nr:hypothetical protein BC943DRAFT_322891 [Umbelopsis sp. AD052]
MYSKKIILLYLLAVVFNKRSSAGATAETKWSYVDWNKDSAISWGKKWKIDHWAYPKDHQQDVTIVNDPQYDTIKVMRVTYPKGSYNPSSSPVGGVGFYAKPILIPKNAGIIKLTYQVYFPNAFEWKLGGKLPGIYGGHSGCSGGNNASTCFSTRLMWRKNGQGELYAYIPKDKQSESLCQQTNVICNAEYGYSFGRGAFSWKTKAWNTITQTIHLNTVGKRDGMVELELDGSTVYRMNSLLYRDFNFTAAGIDFETFFGGSNSSWATPKTQFTFFKGFELSYY